MNKFRFYIDATLVHPYFSDNQGEDWKPYSGEMFYRPELVENLLILNEEYDTIAAQDNEHEYTFLCEKLVSKYPAVWETQFEGVFTKHDVEDFDEDTKTISFKPEVNDHYTQLLKGWDREIDLNKLGLEKYNVKYKRAPLLQLAIKGITTTQIVQYMDGRLWETAEGENWSASQLTDEGFTAEPDLDATERVYVFGKNLTDDVTGKYVYDQPSNTYIRQDAQYNIIYESGDWKIRNAALTELYSTYTTTETFKNFHSLRHDIYDEYVQLEMYTVYSRLLHNSDVSGITNIDVEDDWEIPAFGRLKIRTDHDFNFALITLNPNASSTESDYGKAGEDAIQNVGLYYQLPTGINTIFEPTAKSLWNDLSFWLTISSSTQTIFDDTLETVTLRDGWLLSDVMIALLNEIDPTLHHSPVNGVSQWFYRTNNPISQDPQYEPILTSKSNITTYNYDEPARSTKVKLKDLLQSFKVIFGVYWDIYDWEFNPNPVFRMEHSLFYWLGTTFNYGQYTTGVDLNSAIEAHTGLKWNYHTSKWSYEKVSIPGRIRPRWPDEVSEFFKGEGIELLSAYAEKERSEDPQVPIITTDLNYALSNPDAISPDGLFMLDIDMNSGERWVKEISYTDPVTSAVKTIQNGNLAFTVLQEKYGAYNLPTKTATINGQTVTAIAQLRSRKQSTYLQFFGKINPMQLVWTKIGIGKIASLRKVWGSDEHIMELKHEVN